MQITRKFQRFELESNNRKPLLTSSWYTLLIIPVGRAYYIPIYKREIAITTCVKKLFTSWSGHSKYPSCKERGRRGGEGELEFFCLFSHFTLSDTTLNKRLGGGIISGRMRPSPTAHVLHPKGAGGKVAGRCL